MKKKSSAAELEEEGERGHCSKPQIPRKEQGNLCVNKSFTGQGRLKHPHKVLKDRERMITVTVQNTNFIVFARKYSYFISYMCIYVCVWVMHMCAGASGDQKRTWRPQNEVINGL